jgi:hypothetical protein
MANRYVPKHKPVMGEGWAFSCGIMKAWMHTT